MATAIGVSLATLKRWLSDKSPLVPDSNQLGCFADLTLTSVAYFLGKTDDPKPEEMKRYEKIHNVKPPTVPLTEVPLWVMLPQAVYYVAQNGTLQDIEATIDAMRSGLKVLEHAQSAIE